MKRAWFHRSYIHWCIYQCLVAPYIAVLLVFAAVYDEEIREAVDFWRFSWTRKGYAASVCTACEARSTAAPKSTLLH